MPHKTSALCAAIAITMLTTGCTHHQLQHNTVNQAETVADVHTRQVLDNLAKFAENPNALPHFSWPNAGAADVSDRVAADTGFNLTPHTLAGWMFGVGGSRTSGEAYTMTPINDPRKLELMRCAYQRAVASCSDCGGYESGHCPNCQKRFNNFYLGGSAGSKIKKLTSNGNPISHYRGVEVYSYQDEFDDTKYRYVLTGAEVNNINTDELKPLYVSNTVAEHTLRSGKVTTNCLHGECWFEVGTKLNIPKHLHHNEIGCHGKTCVWVDDCGQDKLTQLTLTILDIALNDPPETVTDMKEVVVYLDKDERLSNRKNASYKITSSIPLTKDITSIHPGSKTKLQKQLSQGLSDLHRIQGPFRLSLNQALKRNKTKTLLNSNAIDEPTETLDDLLIQARRLVEGKDSMAMTMERMSLNLKLDSTDKAILFRATTLAEELLDANTRVTQANEALRQLPRRRVEQQKVRTLPPRHTPVPGAGYLQFQQNLRTLTP